MWEELMEQATQAISREDFEEAIDDFEKALTYAELCGDVLQRYESLTALGAAYGANNQAELAEISFSRAITLCVISDELGAYPLGGCLMSLAYIYRDLGRKDESRAAALRAVKVFVENDAGADGDPSIMLMPLTIYAELSIRESDFEAAALYLHQAVMVFNQYNTDPSCLDFKDSLTRHINQIPKHIKAKFDLVLRKPPGSHATKATLARR